MCPKSLNTLFLMLCLWVLSPLPAMADTIYFNSGRKMDARVLSEEDGKLELALPSGGSMVIDKVDVKRIQKSDPSEITVNFVDGKNSMLVDCILNNTTKATLLVDTGASICMLSKKMGEKLGVDTSDPRYQTKIQVADGSSVSAFYTKIKTLKLQHIEA